MEFTTGGHARGCVVLAYANAIPLGSPTLSKLSPHRPPEGLGVEGGGGEGVFSRVGQSSTGSPEFVKQIELVPLSLSASLLFQRF